MEHIRLEVATAEHLDTLFNLINKVYEIENGDSGVAFKKIGNLRFNEPTELLEYIETGNIMMAIDTITSQIIGCIYAPIFIDKETQIKRLFFGPLASIQRGIGTLLVNYAERKAREHRCQSIDINVVNVRTDVLPWYLRQGFVIIKENPFPNWEESCTRDVILYSMRKEL
jgi:N-acetylglutamate synthase-like GNAT family acetyltransferase